MSLVNMSWKRVSVHEVVAEYLRAERHRFAEDPRALAVIESADTSDPYENHTRLRMLYLRRAGLIGEIPPDTRWYEVRMLTDEELSELHVIARCGWDDPFGQDMNELYRVAARRPMNLTSQPGDWCRPILWGHGEVGPFTIIEGNNRLTAYASKNHKIGLAIPVLIGLSPTPCYFHIFDPPQILVHDFWK
jgi:hypothetical protein